MSREVTVTISDAVFDAAHHRGVFEGHAKGNDPGVAGIIRHALVPYLSQCGYRVKVLRMKDDKYGEYKKSRLEGLSEGSEEVLWEKE